MARAHEGKAFTDDSEFSSWSRIWCQDCVHGATCPLVDVALLGRTPTAWTERNRAETNRYTCHEFVTKEEQ